MDNEAELLKQIVIANKSYLVGKPLLSVIEYDKLILKLRKLNPNHPLLINPFLTMD